jgi:hypothetical protein
MLRMWSPFLYCVIAFCSMAFAQAEPAIAGGIVSPQVLSLPTEEVPPIFLGHRPFHHYVVIIPTSSLEEARSHLGSIQSKVSPYGQMPFITANVLGPYIYAGSFNQRHKANNFLRLLQGESRARVVYFP